MSSKTSPPDGHAVVPMASERGDIEATVLAACKVALRQLEYDGDDKTAFHGAARDVPTKAIAAAEADGPPE